ncbi:ATP-binding protein involved in chromosome partitioning [Dongia mobilis]|uniref:Iron-sulfur cluster carrier protein n=1 Tax=Dongia mobilis TaxID=578943 RepID=A0A4R6WFL4_9PROT|nr:Mrp/NBP35 family ATP-binding protein [Dongia mobilis]TDQ78856.1 ATP-binding protein involved in chromosome partitioning [Dongia mobilis]
MAGTTEGEIRAALASVAAPNGGDIVGRGMVQGLVLRDGHVGFSIEVDPALGAQMEPLRKAAEAAVMKLPGVLSVTAVLTAHKAPPPTPPRQPAAAGRPAGSKAMVPGVRHIIAIASGKGGVGKSTTATNLALAFTTLGLRVGLLDADIYGPSQPRLMGLSGRPESRDGKTLEPKVSFGVKVMSMGFIVEEDTPMIWRGPMVMSAITQLLREVNWGELDILVCDLPPGTGDAQLTMAQSVPLAGAVIVSTPQDIALLDAKKGLNMFRKVDVPVLGLIENMSYFSCPNCGHRSEIFAHGGARREAEKAGVEFLGEIPLDIQIRETSDAGKPIVASEPTSAHALAYGEIAAKIWRKLDTAPQRAAPRIVLQ